MTTIPPRPRLIAFFLPQFHPIAENDRWWGHGFTEWTNVKRARPLFAGHQHPRRPHADRYFDLTDPIEMGMQSQQAREAGIDGFCVYFYWFNGKRLLERPLNILAQMEDGLPYMLSWANESWSRRWDGNERQLLLRQEYHEDTADRIFADMVPYFNDPKYLRQDQKPMLMVHRTDLLPDPALYAQTWRERALDHGFPGIYLIAAETRAGVDPRDWGFDAAAEFPPLTRGRLRNAMLRPPVGLHTRFSGRLLSYRKIAAELQSRPATDFTLHRGVVPAWDNTARRGLSATVVVGHSPQDYNRWLSSALARERRANGAQGMVFVNAWNEWAEGAYLQPDTTYGASYLEATRAAVDGVPYDGPGPSGVVTPRGLATQFHRGHLRALWNAAAASALSRLRGLAGAFQRSTRGQATPMRDSE